MPSQRRENERKEKKQKSEQKTRRIIWIILILVVFVLIIMRVSEVDFKSIKNRFVDENGRITFSMTTNDDAYPFSLSSSGNVKVNPLSDKLNILTDTSCTVLNPTDAKVVYSFNHGYANPIMKYSGNYFCLIDQGATRLRLDRYNDNIYETKTETSILCADVAKNGNVIYATRSKDNKAEITVISSSLKKLMSFGVNSGYVVSVAIDSSGKKCAYAVANSKNAGLVTTVYTINVGDDEERASFDFENSSLMDLHYSNSSELYYVGSDCVSVIKSQKKKIDAFKSGDVNTVCFNYTSDNELVYVYSKYSDANENNLVYINSSGKVKTTIELTQKPKYVSASNDICVLFSDKVVTYSLTKGDVKETYKCDDSVNNVSKLSTKIFISRNQLIDVIN